MLKKEQAKARILSRVLSFISRHGWTDHDDFSLRFVDRITHHILKGTLRFSDVWQSSRTKTSFFQANHISRLEFCSTFQRELSGYMKEIGVDTLPELVSLVDIFEEVNGVSLDEAESLTSKLNIPERQIQDAFRRALREKGATRISQRNSDSVLEIADIEDFSLEIKGRQCHLTVVVKGHRSVKGDKVTLKDISHQIIKTFNGTFPDYILLATAKPLVDGVNTNLVRYGESVGNKNLVIIADAVDVARFLRARNLI